MKTAGTAYCVAALILLLVLHAVNALALTSDELVRLKQADLPEEIIVFMADSGYRDVDKVLRLKEAGFTNGAILAILRSETSKPGSEGLSGPVTGAVVSDKAAFETGGRIKILWYLLYRGEPVLQNRQAVEDVKILLIGDNVIRFEWKEKDELGLLEVFRRKPFPSPFTWEIHPGDTLEPGKEGYPWMLKSTVDHRGKPPTDGKHYWIVYFEPKNAAMTDRLKRSMSGK